MSVPPTRLVVAAASRRGPHHLRNEDAWCVYTGPTLSSEEVPGGLFAVCDGVSTAGRGKLAATLACERLGQFGEPGTPFAVEGLQQLVSEIDWELRGAGRGAYCTLALAWVQGAEAHVLTVGDSPVYRLRRGRLTEAGADASGTVQRSLRAYLGMGTRVSDVLRHQRWSVEPGDLLLLMSDGILDALDESQLISLWQRNPEPKVYVGRLLDEVARIGVDDDATVLAVEVRIDRDAVSPTAPREAPDPPRLFGAE